MGFEKKVLDVVSKVTADQAYFFNGTLFVKTTDSKVACDVFNSIRENITAALAFQKVGTETCYDFLA